jgi:hypothetical protein
MSRTSARRVGPRLPRLVCALGAAAIHVFLTPSARADVTSWLYVGGGIASSQFANGPTGRPGTLAVELGMGSPPGKDVVVGGLFKSFTYFDEGTDLAVALRGASGGFVRGGFGFAVDAGAYERFWGAESVGFAGAIVLGAPFGIQVAATTEQGSHGAHVYGATIGVDFLRLTVYRTAAQSYWPNPFPPSGLDGPRR